MKKKEKILSTLLLVVFVTVSCSSEPELDRNKFIKLERAAMALKTSLAEKTSFQHFAELLQNLSAEIDFLKDKKLTKEEMELLRAYSVLAGVYEDGHVLWKYKLEFAPFGIVPEGRIYVSQDVDPIAFKYNLPTESHLYRPTGQYWKSISEDSIQIIWDNAALQQKIIDGFSRR